MKVEYSKDFERTVRKLSGKLVDYDYIYRIRIGSYRAFFSFHVEIKDGVVRFLYLIPRGQAYNKGTKKNLERNDV